MGAQAARGPFRCRECGPLPAFSQTCRRGGRAEVEMEIKEGAYWGTSKQRDDLERSSCVLRAATACMRGRGVRDDAREQTWILFDMEIW